MQPAGVALLPFCGVSTWFLRHLKRKNISSKTADPCPFPDAHSVYRQLCHVTPEKGIHQPLQGILSQGLQTSSCQSSRSAVHTPSCVMLPLLLSVLSKDRSAAFHQVSSLSLPLLCPARLLLEHGRQHAACMDFPAYYLPSFYIAMRECVRPQSAVASGCTFCLSVLVFFLICMLASGGNSDSGVRGGVYGSWCMHLGSHRPSSFPEELASP